MPHPLQKNEVVPLGEAPANVTIHLTLVRPGRFLMGSNAEHADSDEQPVHEIRFTNHFYIGTFPVTQAQWSAIFTDHHPSRFKGPDLPVESVSWHDIVDGTQGNGPPEAFLVRINRQLEKLPKWTGYAFRLPTEAEWEYAAKGGHLAPKDFGQGTDTTELYSEYAGGDELNPLGWFEDNNDIGSHPVGRKQANQLGLYDLSGNVWEWCADAYDSQTYRERAGKVTENPPAVEATENRPYRVLRGGSWFGSARLCRLSLRDDDDPEYRGGHCGFRLVLAPVRAGE
jgi:formylglycine-generating enzyme required for sulfatase activity